MISLRRTALIWLTLLLAAVGAVAFVISYEFAQQEAANFLDGQLREISLNAGEGQSDASAPPAADQDPQDAFAITIWTRAGAFHRGSPDGASLPRQSRPGFATVRSGDEDWRVYQANDEDRTVQVAQRMSVRQEMATSAGIQAGAPILIVIPLMWLVIGWALGQLAGRLTRLAGRIAERSLDQHDVVALDAVPAEIRPLVDAMNVLTGRLQQALEQQKRFVSDAAHELRTPLAALQLQLDNLQMTQTEPEATAIAAMRGGLKRATALVAQLLHLARSDESSARVDRSDLDLRDIIVQSVADHVAIADSRSIDLGLDMPDPVRFNGSGSDLKLLFDNLIDNAIRYTPPGGSVDVSLRRTGTNVQIDIIDTGVGVAEAVIPHLFERFFRAAPMDSEGSGLGLSIAAAVARRHGLAITVANRIDRSGLCARVTGEIEQNASESGKLIRS